VIDAVEEYGGSRAGQTYGRSSARRRGENNRFALAGFPYVDYHPSIPYSVFPREPAAPQFNVPQVYGKAIGGSVKKR